MGSAVKQVADVTTGGAATNAITNALGINTQQFTGSGSGTISNSLGSTDLNKIVQDALRTIYGGDPIQQIAAGLLPQFTGLEQDVSDVGKKVNALTEDVTEGFGSIGEQITTGLEGITGDVTKVGEDIGKKITTEVGNLSGELATGIGTLTSNLEGLGGDLASGVGDLQRQGAEIGKKVNELGVDLNQQFNTGFETLTGNLEGLSGDLTAGVSNLQNQGAEIGKKVNQLGLDLESGVSGLGADIGGLGSQLSGGLEQVFRNIEGLGGDITSGLGNIQDFINKNTADLQRDFFGELQGGLTNVQDFIARNTTDITSGIGTIGENLSSLGVDLNKVFTSNLEGLQGSLASNLTGLGSEINTGLGGLQDLVERNTRDLTTGFSDIGKFLTEGGLENLLKTNLEGTMATIGGGLGELGKGLENIFGQIGGGLAGLSQGLGLESLFGNVQNLLQTNLQGLQGSLGGLGQQLGTGFTGLTSQLEGGLGQLGGQLTGALGGLEGLLGGLGQQLTGGIQNLGGQLQGGLGALQGNLGSLLSGVEGLGQQLGGQLQGGLGQLGANLGQLGGELTGGLGSILGQLEGGLGSLQGQLAGGLGQLGANIQGLQQSLDASSLGDLNRFLTQGGLEAQLKDFIEKNTTDFRSLEAFDESALGTGLKAAAGIPLATTLLGPTGLLGAIGGLSGGAAGLFGGESDIRDTLLGTEGTIFQDQPNLFTQGQTDLFNQFRALGPKAASEIYTPAQTISTQNFANLPGAQAALPDLVQFNQQNQAGLPTISGPQTQTQQTGQIQTDFLSSLFPQGQQQRTALSDATTQYTQGVGQAPLDTFRNLQDVAGQTQQLDDYFTTNVQNPLLEQFEETILPGISRRFAGGNQFFGSERQRADDLARENLLDTLAQERSRLGFEQFGQARDRALAAGSQQAAAQTAAQAQQSQEALGRGGLALQDLLGRGGLILQQGLGAQGQQLQERELAQAGGLQLDQLRQQAQQQQGNQLLQALGLNLQGQQQQQQAALSRAGLAQEQDRLNLEAALQRATGTQQAQTTLADLLFRQQQANQQAQLQQNAQLAQILGIPQLENIVVSQAGTEGLLQGLLAGGAQGLGAALPGLIAGSDSSLKKNIEPADKEIEDLLDSLSAYKYDYIDDRYGDGERVSIMAQDLEKSELGKRMVTEINGKKFVEYTLPLVLAIQANLNKRLRSLGV